MLCMLIRVSHCLSSSKVHAISNFFPRFSSLNVMRSLCCHSSAACYVYRFDVIFTLFKCYLTVHRWLFSFIFLIFFAKEKCRVCQCAMAHECTSFMHNSVHVLIAHGINKNGIILRAIKRRLRDIFQFHFGFQCKIANLPNVKIKILIQIYMLFDRVPIQSSFASKIW